MFVLHSEVYMWVFILSSFILDDPLPLFAYILFGITGLIIFAAIAVPIYVGCYRSFICRAKMVSYYTRTMLVQETSYSRT